MPLALSLDHYRQLVNHFLIGFVWLNVFNLFFADVKTTETRTVKHYHYLQWKDFNAPEHAPAMLKFVKRINEDHQRSKSLNPPILVHCSAGVGRSGTLVAIDGLVQQLREDGNVTIYSHVCDLRHQRNYLVQSVVSNRNYVNFSPFFASPKVPF